MESMIVASFSVAGTAPRGRKVATRSLAVALASSGPRLLPPASDAHPHARSRPKVLARSFFAYVNLGHALRIAGEAHFLARQFRHRQARAGLREQVFRRHRLEMDVPDAGGLVF